MEEQYYLISKEYLDNLIAEHRKRNWDSVQNSINSNIANALVNVSQKSTLIDLSDKAIEEDATKWCIGCDEQDGFKKALQNLKNKLNANKTI